MNLTKEQRAWSMYDWANSVYSLVISTALFPVYYESVTTSSALGDKIELFGTMWTNTVIYSYFISASFLTIAILSPYLAAMADRTGRVRMFMKLFMVMGSLTCMSMFFFTEDWPELGLLLAYLASIGFAGSLVFYNSMLPLIAEKKWQDRLSARGFMMGYIGSSLLLIGLLVLITFWQEVGFSSKGMATRTAFVLTGLWWLLFGLRSINGMPKDEVKDHFEYKLFWSSWKELIKVFREAIKIRPIKRFLGAFFFYNAGMQTIIYIASIFGSKVLGMETTQLIMTILIIQFIAVAGSYVFSRFSERSGNLVALSWSVGVWVLVCVGAFYVNTAAQFYVLAGVVGLVMGGMQSLSRSTYGKLLPKNDDPTTFFSFYDVLEKLATMSGMFAVGLIESITGDLRFSALLMSAFFFLGLIQLARLRNQGIAWR